MTKCHHSGLAELGSGQIWGCEILWMGWEVCIHDRQGGDDDTMTDDQWYRWG